MVRKPTYEELEQRVKGLETEVDNSKQIDRDVLVLKAAIEQVPVGIALADENLSLYFCNPAGLGLRGGDKAGLVEIPKDAFDNWQVLKLNGEPYEIDDLPLVKAVTTGKTVKEEFIVKHQDGSEHICAATAAPVYENNYIIGGMVIFPDVTERIKVAKALKESEAKHKEMIANISDVIAIMDSNGIIGYKSPNIEKWFGWHPEDLVGTDGWETVHPDDLERVQKDFFTLLEQDKSEKRVEYRYKCKDESYKWIELTAVNLVKDSNVNGILMNYHDITERNRAEEALRESEAKFRVMMEAMKAAVYICSPDFRVEYMNPAMIQRTGRDATGEHCFKALHGLKEKCSWCMHDKAQQNKCLEFEIVSPKDNRSYYISQSSIVHKDGSISKMTIFSYSVRIGLYFLQMQRINPRRST